MIGIDVASIVFVCVAANHLGLIKAIEGVAKKEIPILNCPKCFTFWCTLAYGLWNVGISDLPLVLAISFLNAYLAIWLELGMGYIDTLYNKVYEKIYSDPADDTTTADSEVNTAGSVSELRKDCDDDTAKINN